VNTRPVVVVHNVVPYVAVCCRMCSDDKYEAKACGWSPSFVVVLCGVLQRVLALCCSVLQCVAVVYTCQHTACGWCPLFVAECCTCMLQ